MFMGGKTVVPVAGPGGGITRVGGKLHVCRVCPCGRVVAIRCSSSNVSRTCGRNGKAAAFVRSGISSGGGIGVSVHPARNSFSNFMGRGTARFEMGIATGPGGISTRVNGNGIGLARISSVSSFQGNRGMCFCSTTPGLGGFTAGNDRFRGGIVAGGPRILIGLTTASVAGGRIMVSVRNFRCTPTSGCEMASNSLATPTTQVTTRSVRTCALGPA